MKNNIRINTGIKDSEGNEYSIGDVVFNQFFGDYWVVGMYKGSKIEKYEVDCPYYLALFNDPDDYFEDLNVPEGFRIICKQDDSEYKQLIKTLNKIRRQRKRFELGLIIKYKIYKPIELLGKFGKWLIKEDKKWQTGNTQSKTAKKN